MPQRPTFANAPPYHSERPHMASKLLDPQTSMRGPGSGLGQGLSPSGPAPSRASCPPACPCTSEFCPLSVPQAATPWPLAARATLDGVDYGNRFGPLGPRFWGPEYQEQSLKRGQVWARAWTLIGHLHWS